MAFIESTNHYIVQKEIGKGAFGHALLVRSIVNMNEFYVIKVIDVDNALAKVGYNKALSDKILNQIKSEASQLTMGFVHDNIVQMYSSFTERNKLYIALEYCPCGTLLQLIHQRLSYKEKSFSEGRIQHWARQLVSAMELLHKNNVIHRDLKSENIFVADNNQTLKIGDFGFAKKLEVFNQLATTFAGTRFYMAPEILTNEPYTLKVDIWSLGVVLYEVAALRLPFNNGSGTIRGSIPTLPDCFSKQFVNLVTTKMLVADPSKRASIREIASDPWFKTSFPKTSIISANGDRLSSAPSSSLSG